MKNHERKLKSLNPIRREFSRVITEYSAIKYPLGLIERHRALLAILSLAFAIRLTFFLAIQPWDSDVVSAEILFQDAIFYNDAALSLRQTANFDSGGTIRTPGYILFVAGTYLISNDAIWFTLLIQLLIDVGTVILVYATAMILFRRHSIGLIAAGLYATSFLASYYSVRLLSETLFTALLTGALLFYWKALGETRGWKWLLVAGVLLGLAALVRPIAFYIPIVLILGIALSRGITRSGLTSALVVAVTMLVVMSPWQMRNFVEHGHYSLSTAGEFNLLHGHAALTEARANGISWGEANKRLVANLPPTDLDPFETAAAKRNLAISYITSDVPTFVRFHLQGVFDMFFLTVKGEILYNVFSQTPKHDESQRCDFASILKCLGHQFSSAPQEYFLGPILMFMSLLVYGAALTGTVMLARRRAWVTIVVVVGIVVYFSAVTGVMGQERFRAPLLPLIMPISAYGLHVVFGNPRWLVSAAERLKLIFPRPRPPTDDFAFIRLFRS